MASQPPRSCDLAQKLPTNYRPLSSACVRRSQAHGLPPPPSVCELLSHGPACGTADNLHDIALQWEQNAAITSLGPGRAVLGQAPPRARRTSLSSALCQHNSALQCPKPTLAPGLSSRPASGLQRQRRQEPDTLILSWHQTLALRLRAAHRQERRREPNAHGLVVGGRRKHVGVGRVPGH